MPTQALNGRACGLLVVFVFGLAACGSAGEKSGQLGFIGDRIARIGYEFWRAPDGKTLYFRPQNARSMNSNSYAGVVGFQCSATAKVVGRSVWHWPERLRGAGEPWFTRPEPHRFASQAKVWERFGATADEAKLQLADTRPAAKPKWVGRYERCVAHNGRR